MQIPDNFFQARSFSSTASPRPVSSLAKTAELEAMQATQRIQNQSRIDTITPQSYQHGNVAQLINSRYLYELRKDIRRVLRGRKLKEMLDYDYTLEEFENLPTSLKNLIVFDKSISTAEVLQFMEAFDKSHEITFKDYSFDRIKFRALFEALGDLIDVEMQAGPSSYIPLSDGFEIKKKITEVFGDLKDKITERLTFKTSKSNGKRKIKPPKAKNQAA